MSLGAGDTVFQQELITRLVKLCPAAAAEELAALQGRKGAQTFMNLLFKALAAVLADIIAIIHEFLFYYSRVTERPACVLWAGF